MVLELRTKLPPSEAESVIAQIQAITANGHELTPRPDEKLRAALNNGELITVYSGLELVGWGLIEPLTKNCSELGLTYIKPSHRGSAAFELLSMRMTAIGGTLLFATYDAGLMSYATRLLGFRPSSLGEFLKVSRGRFVFKRLNRESRKSIRGRMRTAKPLYGIRVGS